MNEFHTIHKYVLSYISHTYELKTIFKTEFFLIDFFVHLLHRSKMKKITFCTDLNQTCPTVNQFSKHFNIEAKSSYSFITLRALSDERFLGGGGQAALAMSHERFGR